MFPDKEDCSRQYSITKLFQKWLLWGEINSNNQYLTKRLLKSALVGFNTIPKERLLNKMLYTIPIATVGRRPIISKHFDVLRNGSATIYI